jgi:hypothetical protein
MKINIESFTNPITEDILQRKDFQYPSGNIQVQVNTPPEVINLLNNINQSLQQLLFIFNLEHIGGDIQDIKEKQDTLRDILLNSLNNITQLLAQTNMYLESLNNVLRNQH